MRYTGNQILEKAEILDAGSEGMAIAKVDDMVVFVPFVVPGDIVDIRIIRKKKSYAEGRAVFFHHYSERRTEPWCRNFGTCGGCRWQNMKYEDQLYFKQKQVSDNLIRIGKLVHPAIMCILPSPSITHYRNKLDFTFSNHRWLTDDDVTGEGKVADTNAVGFHVPGFWDKVGDLQECFHMPEPSNALRNAAREYALQNGLSFYDARKHTGFLRNLIVRITRNGGIMVILVVSGGKDEGLFPMLDYLAEQFTYLTSLYYIVNDKQNDTISDLDLHLYKGEPYITEEMAPFREGGKVVKFRIGPASFFQTNPAQAENLYRMAADFAGLHDDATVYDLYTGAGTIANYVAPYVKKVVGIESVAAAVEDAEANSALNGITNTVFFAGETEKILSPEFFQGQGRPDIVITDPPRSGMHEKVVKAILEAAPRRVVYVSCNPATQARDIAWMSEQYEFVHCRPVDMFPHTQHVENVALLQRRDQTV